MALTPEHPLVWLILTLLLIGVGLAVFLAISTLFLQGYFYTETNQSTYWQAPAAAAVITLFFVIWCSLNAYSSTASSTNVPYDTVFRFSPESEMFSEPVPYLWSIKTGARKDQEEKVKFKRTYTPGPVPGQKRTVYKELVTPFRPWSPNRVVAIEIPRQPDQEGDTIRFDRQEVQKGEYPRFVSGDGWIMYEYDDGITGAPTRFHFGWFLFIILWNLLHLAVWFVCLWLLLRFQPMHALGLALVVWLAVTVAVLPGMLTWSASLAPKATNSATEN